MQRLRRGVITESVQLNPLDLHRARIEAAVPFLGEATYFAHESAAVLHGLPLLAPRLAQIVAVRTGGGHGAITDTLHARRADVDDFDLTAIDGVPVTGLARTASDLLRRLTFPEAVMIADAALRAGLTESELLDRTRSGRGCRMAAAAIAFADARSESAGESLSRVRIQRAGFPTPDLQVSLCGAAGRFLARLDFWWEEYRLAGEFDGMIKYSTLLAPGQTSADVIRAEKRREQDVIAEGNRVVRWGWDDLWNGNLEHRLARAFRAQHR